MNIRKITAFLIFTCFIGIFFIGSIYIYVQPQLPDVSKLKDVQLNAPLTVYSEDGKVLSQFGEKRRIPLTIEDIPQTMIDAFIATEDSRFYEHNGVDPIGILRAALVLIATGKKSQGASTITMQVARNFFLSREKTYIRKIKEIFVALHIEQTLEKNDILELYFNRSFFGHRAYGVGAAAQVYYGKDVNELTLPETAMIAGLPQSPSIANPIRNPERAMKRRNVVLMRMLDMGFIQQQAYDNAINAPVSATYHRHNVDFYAPYIAEMARTYLVDKFGKEVAYSGGYSIYTTIDSNMQYHAQEALKNNIFAYDERHGYRGEIEKLWSQEAAWSVEKIVEYLADIPNEQTLKPAVVTKVSQRSAEVVARTGETITLPWEGISWARKYISDTMQGKHITSAQSVLSAGDLIWIRLNETKKIWQLSQPPEVTGALVSIAPYDGSIKALVGGYNFNQSQYNRAIQAERQIGSNIKPFIYAAALEQGKTLASLFNNAPINQWDQRQGIAWRPKNSPDVYTGPTRMRLALGKSINVISVRLMREVGLNETINELIKFGFKKESIPRNESLALGSGSVTPLEVARAYSVFANKGFLIEPYFINYILDADGNHVMQSSPRVACSNCSDALEPNNNLMVPAVQAFCPLPKERLATRVLDSAIAFLITDAMSSVIWGGGNWKHDTGWTGTGWRAARTIKRRDIYGKTGTTNESKDSWFSGFSPYLTTTAWVGFDDNQRQLGSVSDNKNVKNQIVGAESGAKTAGPMWNEFMKNVLKPFPERTRIPPQNIISVRIDRTTGLLSRHSDHTSRFEYFIEGTEPTSFTSSASTTIDDDFTISEDEAIFD
jgi:penicillin-binding protein 1A